MSEAKPKEEERSGSTLFLFTVTSGLLRKCHCCSAHFKAEDFTRKFVFVPGQSPRLTKDDIGVMAVPSVYKQTEEPER
jgi:hypothetical protein